MTVAVISAIFGDYDQPILQPPQTVDARWILVTDHEIEAPGWDVIVDPVDGMHPRLAAKWAKCMPWRYAPDAETTVWMDGACRLLKPTSLDEILDRAGGAPLAQIVHPWRDCIYDEAHESQPIPKYRDHPCLEQVQHYRDKGHPEHWGLWATGLMVRNVHGPNDIMDDMAFGLAWLVEQYKWTYQDQLSEPYVLFKTGRRPQPLGFDLHGSGILEWLNHRTDQ